MECFIASTNIALYALAFRLLADVTVEAEFLIVELASVRLVVHVVALEPNFVDPVHANNVHPLLGLELHDCTLLVVAQKTLGHLRARVHRALDHEGAPVAVPGVVVICVLHIQVFPVAASVHNHVAQVANHEWVILFVELAAADVACPVVLVLILLADDVWEASSDHKCFI